MSERAIRAQLPSRTGMVAGGVVAIGILLWMFVSKAFLFVAGLGAFGPGLLRELGWLSDQDEFQRQAAYRAGYHAYLVAGLFATLVVSGIESGRVEVRYTTEVLNLVIVALWLSWMFSSLLAFWGVRKTTSRILVVFGSFWAVFVIATLIGEGDLPPNPEHVWLSLLGTLVGIGLVAPWFVLARTVRRRPRITGISLVGLAAIFFVAFGAPPGGGLSIETRLLTSLLLIGPLLVCGVALLREGDVVEAEDDRDGGADDREPLGTGAGIP